MKRLLEEMEMPLSLVLYDMQKEGVAVKREELKAYGDALAARIEELRSPFMRRRERNLISIPPSS